MLANLAWQDLEMPFLLHSVDEVPDVLPSS